mgnify:CR=1 FL=1
MGRFDFDAQRGYPEDVDELVAAFPGAWVNAHTSAGLGTDPDTHAEQPFNSAGYALKQYGKDGRVESIRDSFEQYLTWLYRDSVPQRVTEPVSFLMDSGKFRGILVIADAWKEIGWSSIIYFAAIAGLDQECFEAADVDGATRIQKIWYITLPSLLPTIVLMLISASATS